MSHGAALNIDLKEVLESEPIRFSPLSGKLLWWCVTLGAVGFFIALSTDYPRDLLWGVYYTNLCYWMGLACGGVMTTAIFQIVRAKWSPPVRRIGEANVAFLPWAYLLLLGSWFGKEHLFYWGRDAMPGREWWMQPGFVYLRFAVLFLGLFYLMWFYVRLSLRSDLGLLRERSSSRPRWTRWVHQLLSRDWRGSEAEVKTIQRQLSWYAPLLVLIYVLVFSLFAFEMVMGMDPKWFSNLFGAFTFIGNIYIAWAAISILVVFLTASSREYAKVVSTQQLWDLGKLVFGFCMLWAYMFFSQFLAQWYGNLPEETEWLITRTRVMPWWTLGWVTFSMCFIIPFIVLLSEDVKRTPRALAAICAVIMLGVWFERYMTIMPQLSPSRIPLSLSEILLNISVFLGFLGLYGLSIKSFLARFPFVPVSHPLTSGSRDW